MQVGERARLASPDLNRHVHAAPEATARLVPTGRRGDLRCCCGSLVARWVAGGLELKCRRCKRLVFVPFDGNGRTAPPERPRADGKAPTPGAGKAVPAP